MATTADVMVAFLLAFPAESFCVQCLARKTAIAQHEIRIAANDAIARGRVTSRKARCSRCRRALTVLSAPAGATPDVPGADCAAG